MRKRPNKKRIIQNIQTLTCPSVVLSCAQIRNEIVQTIAGMTKLYREPESRETDLEERICWMLLIMSQIDGLDVDGDYADTAEWWYTRISSGMKSEKQKELLAQNINACASSL